MERYINIRQILDDLLEHPLLQDLSFERAINHCVDFIRIVVLVVGQPLLDILQIPSI